MVGVWLGNELELVEGEKLGSSNGILEVCKVVVPLCALVGSLDGTVLGKWGRGMLGTIDGTIK